MSAKLLQGFVSRLSYKLYFEISDDVTVHNYYVRSNSKNRRRPPGHVRRKITELKTILDGFSMEELVDLYGKDVLVQCTNAGLEIQKLERYLNGRV